MQYNVLAKKFLANIHYFKGAFFMKKLTTLLLILFLFLTPVALTACDVSESDSFVDEIIFSVLGEDNAFAEQMSHFKIFMQTEVYVKKLINAFTEIAEVVKDVRADDPLSWIGLGFAVISNWAAWLAAILVYLVCIVAMLLYDLILMVCYAVGFILLAIIYLFNSLLVWLAALTV